MHSSCVVGSNAVCMSCKAASLEGLMLRRNVAWSRLGDGDAHVAKLNCLKE